MPTTREQFDQWLAEPEGVRLEFKEARHNYHFEKLVEYCVALANEGGGQILFGVTDQRPRVVIGSAAFAEPGRTEAGLYDPLSRRIPDVTPADILDQQNPRNRRLAEALAKCGLIERSGQGMNLMFETAVRQSKPLPSFAGTSAHEVRLTLEGGVRDPAFVRFIERLGDEALRKFATRDYLVLEYLHREHEVPAELKDRLPELIRMGAVEVMGRGKGTRYLLSEGLYAALGAKGTHTRKKGLDRDTNKALLLKHLVKQGDGGAPLAELRQVLPALTEVAVQTLLQELRNDGQVVLEGQKRWARWKAVPPISSKAEAL